LRLTTIYLRFFKSFNYDYERKAHPQAEPYPWEELEEGWFPFVRVPIDPIVTAVVGANESGKSHLIKAIRQGLTAEGIRRSDFCRYSSLYSVETGQLRVPDIGVELAVEDQDLEPLGELDLAAPAVGQRLTLLRLSGGRNVVLSSSGDELEIEGERLERLNGLLPQPFELETDVGLPDSMSLDRLIGDDPGPLGNRARRFDLFERFRNWGGEAETIRQHADELAGVFTGNGSESANEASKEQDLAQKLLVDVAKIDRSSFRELRDALQSGEEGRVDGLIDQMNRSLARHLNFARWWHQDSDFQLRVESRERELVFTIRDRTGSGYSFNERSTGLKYFLGYYVQLRAHKRPPDRRQVLLMDEPDAFLSSTGQQDLLRTLENFAQPEDGSRQDQVVYVTHSPFLINKNAAQRIRVLDKGSEEEGTRVVRDVARNHYEPLRSSIGAYVAETAFIDGANLIVEGVADQVLLVGVNALLRDRGTPPRELIDLNQVTIVPAGSASEVPYLAYLARGRDEVKPPCAALLDSDRAGKAAAQKLARGEADGRRVLDADYVLELGSWAQEADLKIADGIEVIEIEDLVPTKLAVGAARSYAVRFLRLSDQEASKLSAAAVDTALATKKGVWAALTEVFAKTFEDAHIDKTGFAKELTAYLERVKGDDPRPSGLPDLEHNFAQLIAALASRLRDAERVEIDRRRERRVNRLVKAFLDDHPDGAIKDAAQETLGAIAGALEAANPDDDATRNGIVAIRKDFKLNVDPLSPVPDFTDFRDRLVALRYQERLSLRDESEPAPS
jgi:predicted ATPase